ncbi:unnamed protein product, partial [Tilletia controversa]
CLDGNFQHKRHKAQDALRQSPRRPTSFISRQQLEAARKVFENPNVGEGPRTGCSADVKAAIDGFVKTSRAQFDIGGVVGMTCRHGSPLILVNVHDTGEKHYYAYALLTQLLDACGTALDHLGPSPHAWLRTHRWRSARTPLVFPRRPRVHHPRHERS